MPTVGKKTFPYTKPGVDKAKAVAKKTGKKVTMSKKGTTALQEMFNVEQYEAKTGKKDKETKKDVSLEKKMMKKKGKK